MSGSVAGHLTKKFTGRAHVFGDHISTDEILPGKYLDRPYSEVGQFAMAGVDEDFASKVEPGDVVVAGINFGCGSSREAAVIALKKAEVAAVIAPSFARIFFRNAVNNGLVPVVVPSTDGIQTGDTVEVDLEARVVRVRVRGRELPILNLKGISFDILQAGGIVEFTLKRMQARGHPGAITSSVD